MLPGRQDRRPSIGLEGLTDADLLLALAPDALDCVLYEANQRLGATKRRRADLLKVSPTDTAALVEANG